MVDRLEEVIESLPGSLEMMQSGWLKTSNEGHDTTSGSVSQTMGWIDELEAALRNHRNHKG
jgi:hypothetical protein